jgi:hypothetical protein
MASKICFPSDEISLGQQGEEGTTWSNFFWYVNLQRHTLHSQQLLDFYRFFMYSNTTFNICCQISEGLAAE